MRAWTVREEGKEGLESGFPEEAGSGRRGKICTIA